MPFHEAVQAGSCAGMETAKRWLGRLVLILVVLTMDLLYGCRKKKRALGAAPCFGQLLVEHDPGNGLLGEGLTYLSSKEADVKISRWPKLHPAWAWETLEDHGALAPWQDWQDHPADPQRMAVPGPPSWLEGFVPAAPATL